MAQAAKRKKRKSKKPSSDSTGSSWAMLVIGLVCGAVLSGLYFGYKENEPGRFGSGIRSLLESEAKPEPPAEQPVSRRQSKPEPRLELDYHEVLPNIDEVISESDLVTDGEPVAERPDQDHEYVLQAGSYKAESDAESMKAKLALSGFEPVIQRVNIDGKGTYYRVRLGPYQSKRKLHLDKKRLAKQGIDSVAMRLKKPEEQAEQTQ